MKFISTRRLAWIAPLLLALAACGGGGGSSGSGGGGDGGGGNGGGGNGGGNGGGGGPSDPPPVVTPIGVTQGPSVSASLSVAGGSLSSADGKLKITIPEGALAAATTVSIQPISNGAPGRVGAAYRLLPEGTTFAKPVQLSFTYTDADVVGASADVLGVAVQKANGTWAWQASTLNSAARTVTVSTTHFSDWSAVKGLQLRPPSGTVKTGGSVPLKLVYCFAPPLKNTDLEPLGFDCEAENAPVPPSQTVNWAVNGIAGGNATVGTVTGNGNSATYTAPAHPPQANPVAVSAEVQGAKGKLLLISNILVTEDFAGYTGSISGTVTDVASGTRISYQTSDLSFIPLETPPTNYAARGSLTMTTRHANGDVSTQTVTLGEGSVLTVYDPVLEGPFASFAGRYFFSVMGLFNACPEEVIAGGTTLPAYGNDQTRLEGTRQITCGGGSVAIEAQWNLKRGS